MSANFPPMPPHDQLRVEDGDLVFRAAEISDAEAIFALTSDPNMPFMIAFSRPASVAQLQESFKIIEQREAAGEPAQGLYWIIEYDGVFIGVLNASFDMLDKSGGRDGLLLRSAMWQFYLGLEFVQQGMASRMRMGALREDGEEILVRHFKIEQLVAWIDDTNDVTKALLTSDGWEGPINHNHKAGLGFYRRSTHEFPE